MNAGALRLWCEEKERALLHLLQPDIESVCPCQNLALSNPQTWSQTHTPSNISDILVILA
jgi:hypothetical protein